MNDEARVLERVRRVLGRGGAPLSAPLSPPPRIADEIARLVKNDARLTDVFIAHAAEQKMVVTPTPPAQVAGAVVSFVSQFPICRVALASSPLLERLNVAAALTTAGLEVRRWDEMTLDEMYDFDCAVTDVTYAVAEIGGLLIKPSVHHGRALSLVPMYHLAIVESRQVLPDLIDLLARLVNDPDRANFILIAGPSKTADIEMNVVTGVHGPNLVNVFLLV